MDDLETLPESELSTEETIDLGESIEESIAAAFEETAPVEDSTTETEEPKADPITEAARTLANAKRKGKKREVREAATLEPTLEPKGKAEPQQTEQPRPERRFEPPARFPVAKKEWFNQQPPEVQEEIAKAFGEWESYFTKHSQEIQRHLDDNREITRIVGHYMPQWGVRGLTPSQAIAELCATQTRLVDPKTRMEETDRLLRRLGVEPEHIVHYRAGGVPPSTPQQNPTLRGLTPEDVDRILEQKLSQSQRTQETAAQVQELAQLRQETNPDGTYKYRELWEPEYAELLDSLVPRLRKTHPGLSLTEATRRAINGIRASEGRAPIGSPSPQQPPKVSDAQEIQRVKAASVSMRGRGNPNIQTLADPAADEKIEDSLWAVWNGTSGAY